MTSSKPLSARVPGRPGTVAGLLFLLALAMRLLFLWASPDAAWAHSAWYRGDAETWIEWARALLSSVPFEADLPIRPPGTAYLIGLLWNGDSADLTALKVLWCGLGALTVVPLYLAARRSLGSGIALSTGLLCAGATGLMILSTSLNNEAPYLLLVAASIDVTDRIRLRPRLWLLLGWASIHALSCLVRAEHLLYFLLVAVFLAWSWARTSGHGKAAATAVRRAALASVGLAFAVFALVLLPWHLSAWSQIRRFNTEPRPAGPGTEDAQTTIEQQLRGIAWSDDALAELDRMPAAARRTARLFVAATEVVRGRRRVTIESLEILDQAFGSRPRKLDSHPYLALYGGLNFYLANNAGASDGFSRAPLERPPQLAGGADRYPVALLRGLPPPQLALSYPPHLDAVNRGYSLGWAWIRDHPLDYLVLAGRRLRVFWRGAALGMGGYNLPLGMSGTRRQVDLVVPDPSAGAIAWRLGVLILVLTGAWIGRREPTLVPWTAFLASKLAVTLAFFGYARQGASVIPVVALLVSLAGAAVLRHLGGRRAEPGPPCGKACLRVCLAAAALLLTVEVQRFVSRPEILVDGRPAGASPSFPAHDHRDRRVEVR